MNTSATAAENEIRFRNFEFRASDASGDCIPCVVSTDAPVMMSDGEAEVLQHSPSAIDLSRAPLPLIDMHDTKAGPFGVVEDLQPIGGKLRGRVRFGNTPRARELLADVKAGVLRSLSVGYQILKYHYEGAQRIVTLWRPYEVSCVPVPADPGAGFYRSAEVVMDEHEERERAAGIVRAARMFDAESSALDAIQAGTPLSEFRQRVMLHAATRPAALGMSRSELRRYSLSRALASVSQHPHMRERGFEWEVSEECARRHVDQHGAPLLGQPGLSFYIPPDVAADILRRDLTVASASGGGYLVDTQNAPSWVELVRPRSVALTLGVESLDGLRSNVTVAKETSGPTVTWHVTEASQSTEGTPGLSQIALAPKTVSAYVEASRQLLLQSSPAVDRLLARSLIRALATAIDVGVLNGSGAAGQPTGLMLTNGIGTVAGAALALAGVLEFQTDIGDALSPFCGYATTRAVASLLAQRESLAGSGVPLWTGNLYEGQLGGYRAMSSGNIPDGALAFGDWPSILLASWGTLAVELNQYANFTAAIVGFRCVHSIDVGVLRPSAFSVATGVN